MVNKLCISLYITLILGLMISFVYYLPQKSPIEQLISVVVELYNFR